MNIVYSISMFYISIRKKYMFSIVSIVLEAPMPNRSFGDKTSLCVTCVYIYIYICFQISSNFRTRLVCR